MIVAALALLAAQPGYPQAPSGMGQQQQRGGGDDQRYPGVSDAGNQLLQRALGAPDQQLDALARQQRGLRDAINQAASAQTVDVDQLAGLIKQREDLQAQFRQRLDARLIAVLRQLAPADRNAFARALATPQGGPGGGGMPPR